MSAITSSSSLSTAAHRLLSRLLSAEAAHPFSKDSHLIFKTGECRLSRPSSFSNRHHSSLLLLHQNDDIMIHRPSSNAAAIDKEAMLMGMADVRRLIQLTYLERLRRRLKALPRDCMSYVELVDMCRDYSTTAGSSPQQIVRSLDQSGNVLVLGDTVFLHPERVARTINGALAPYGLQNPLLKELVKMKAAKEEIDKRAKKLARRELSGGLALLLLQTAGSMRVTFWELSWDVMEPICFFGTSLYFLAGYAFFLITSTKPSFDHVFRFRIAAKQKQLIRQANFDVQRFNQLQDLFKNDHMNN